MPAERRVPSLPFMAGVKAALVERGVADDRVHHEVFGPDRELASA